MGRAPDSIWPDSRRESSSGVLMADGLFRAFMPRKADCTATDARRSSSLCAFFGSLARSSASTTTGGLNCDGGELGSFVSISASVEGVTMTSTSVASTGFAFLPMKLLRTR